MIYISVEKTSAFLLLTPFSGTDTVLERRTGSITASSTATATATATTTTTTMKSKTKMPTKEQE